MTPAAVAASTPTATAAASGEASAAATPDGAVEFTPICSLPLAQRGGQPNLSQVGKDWARALDTATSIQILPDRKQPDSKSGKRYQRYAKARTLGEFFELHVGGKALALQDLYNDVARGHILFDSRIARPAAADALRWPAAVRRLEVKELGQLDQENAESRGAGASLENAAREDLALSARRERERALDPVLASVLRHEAKKEPLGPDLAGIRRSLGTVIQKAWAELSPLIGTHSRAAWSPMTRTAPLRPIEASHAVHCHRAEAEVQP